MKQTFCCNAMNEIINDPELPIEYKPKMKRYTLVGISKAFRDANEITKSYDIEYCIECGTKLPKPLADKWLPIIEAQFNITQTLQESLKKLPKNNSLNSLKKTNNDCFSLEKTITYIPKILNNINKKLEVKLTNTTDSEKLQILVTGVQKHIKELESVILLAQDITVQKNYTKILFYLYRHLLNIIEDLNEVSEIAIKAFQNHSIIFLGDDEYPCFTPGARLEFDEE